MKKVSRVLIAVAAGVFLAGLLLEASLWFLHLARESRPLSGKESFTILCVGNSFTKGDGAPKGESYPELLEKQLLAENLRVKVVNGGESNATTTLLLRRLPRQLEDLKPKIVTFMVGDPNYWFDYGRARYLARRENSSRALKIRAAFENFLFSLRSVNWLRIFLSRYPSSPPELSTDQWLGFLNNVHFDLHWISRSITLKAKEALGKSFAAGSKNPEIPLALSILAARTGETQEAEHWLKEALKLAPGRYFLEYDHSLSKIQADAPLSIKKTASTISKMLAPSRPEPKKLKALQDFHFFNLTLLPPKFPRGLPEILRCDYIDDLLSYAPMDVARHTIGYRCRAGKGDPRAADLLFDAIERNPFTFHTRKIRDAIEKDLHAQTALGERLQARITGFKSRFPQSKLKFEKNNSVDTADWVLSDLREMVSLARASGARVLLQAYPPLRNQRYRKIDELMPEMARELEVPFSDTQKAIRTLPLSDSQWEKLFSNEYGTEDHHLSGKGNKKVAEILRSTLRELGWL